MRVSVRARVRVCLLVGWLVGWLRICFGIYIPYVSVFTRTLGESYRRQIRSFLLFCSCGFLSRAN